MDLKEKHAIERNELMPMLQEMLRAAGLEEHIPDTYVRIKALQVGNDAEWMIVSLLKKHAVLLSDTLNQEMRIISIAHEVGHMKVDLKGWRLRFIQSLFRMLFFFHKSRGKRGEFGQEFFIEAFVAPQILYAVRPDLMPLQKERIHGLVAEYAPPWLHKPLWRLGALLLLLATKKGRFISLRH